MHLKVVDTPPGPIKDDFLSPEEANKLKIGDELDHANIDGKFMTATVASKCETNLKIHYNGCGKQYDTYSDYQKEPHRFAKPRSIAQRKAHRLTHLQKGDYVLINPLFNHVNCEWICGQIKTKDDTSGQIQVAYQYENKNYLYWFHLDDTNKVKYYNMEPQNMKGNEVEECMDDDLENDEEKADQIITGPSLTSKEPLKREPNHFKIHVAIDFGTDGIALAYAVNDDMQRVFIHTEWANLKFSVNEKPKTIILLDEDYNALKFGEDAKYMYISMPMMKDKWLLFERFKMSLYEKRTETKCDDTKWNDSEKKPMVAIVDTLTAANGKKVESSIVFIAAFKHLQELAKKYLKRQKIRCKDSEYQWIITVPAIWNDEAKYKMRQWTIDAGLVDENIEDQCKIVYEPDCASLAIQYEIQQRQSERHNSLLSNSRFSLSDHDDDNKYNENKELPAFAAGDRYILVDAGGGTVDVACHQILGELDNFGVKEIHHPSGGPWGSCYIDDEFIKLLKNIFNEEWIEDFKQKHPGKYTQLLHNFQNAKQSFYQDQNIKTHNVQMPVDFLGFIQDKIEENMDNETEMKHVVSSSKVFGQSNIVSLDKDYLEIDVTAWKLMFDHVMNPIIEHIKNLLNKPNISEHCKYLCLVGGLSISPYFHLRMEWQFGLTSKYRLILIMPQRPILAVVMGAAYFGITKHYIKARRLQYTYGQKLDSSQASALKANVSATYILNNKYYDMQRKNWYVSNCFNVIARKNEEICTGQVIKSYSNKNRSKDKISSKTILYSDMEYPTISTHGKAMGKIVTQFNINDTSFIGMTLEFHFYDTIIKVISYPDNAPNKKQTHYITNYK